MHQFPVPLAPSMMMSDWASSSNSSSQVRLMEMLPLTSDLMRRMETVAAAPRVSVWASVVLVTSARV